VFAQYQVGEGAASTQHLSVLKVSGDRILEQKDLTDTRLYSASRLERPSANPHRTASIGTGHAADSNNHERT